MTRMRNSLAGHLADAVRRGRVRMLARTAARAACARIGRDPPAFVAGPILATFAVTWRCPLACAMCDLPARAGAEIPDHELVRWVDAIADLGPAGRGFTGGEPLVRRALFPALERSVARGLVTHLNTSGVPVTEEVARRVADLGLASINVSIDHADPAEHDALRGRDGAFERAMIAIGRLAAARGTAATNFRLQVVMAVSIANAQAIPALGRRARDAGCDALSLLPVHDFGAAHVAGAPDAALAERLAVALRHARVENSPRYVRGIAPFLAGFPTPASCSAPRTGLFVDPTGRAFACTPSATDGRLGISATPESLATIVRSGALAATVPAGACSRCWWNCHRELDVAIGRL